MTEISQSITIVDDRGAMWTAKLIKYSPTDGQSYPTYQIAIEHDADPDCRSENDGDEPTHNWFRRNIGISEETYRAIMGLLRL